MIEAGQRGLATGNTGSGKSLALAQAFGRYPDQRILIDVADDYELGDQALEEGASEADRLEDLDWSQRTLRFVPRTFAQSEYDDLYAVIWQRGRMLVWLDEAYPATTAHATPPALRRVVTQGRKRGITHLAASQRPAGVERTLINQAEHAFVFLTVDRDDIDVLAFRIGMTSHQLADALRGLEQFGYLYHRLGDTEAVAMPPLSPALIQASRRHVRLP